MLKCCSLYSGSSGNCFFIKSQNANILIDVGVSCKKIENSLKEQFNLSLNDINAIFITHEHTDHTKGLDVICSKYNIPVYATRGTWCAIEKKNNNIKTEFKNNIELNKSFIFKDLRFFAFPTPHDALEPCGFNIYNNNSKISIATDIGHVDDILFNHLKESSFIMIESNYEPNILKLSSYPYMLKQRIASNTGHLSNIDAGKTISKLIEFGLKDCLLIHLSKENNMPEIAYETISESLNSNYSINKINVEIAPRNSASKIFNIN